jgi:hypothetical protein
MLQNFVSKNEKCAEMSRKDILDPTFEARVEEPKPKGTYCSQCKVEYHDYYQHIRLEEHQR